jgi:hypothetical protein
MASSDPRHDREYRFFLFFSSFFPPRININDPIGKSIDAGIEKEQLDRCTHVFLAKCCGWAAEDEELTGEIEAKMSLMRLHEEQQNQCGDEGNTNEKMHLAIEIAVLYLGEFTQLDLHTVGAGAAHAAPAFSNAVVCKEDESSSICTMPKLLRRLTDDTFKASWKTLPSAGYI